MTRIRLQLFVAFAVIAAAGCIRLGFWQISRLHQRQARNALVKSRLDSAEVDVGTIPRDTAVARFRRVRVTGVPDYEHELVYAARTHAGSPGVNLLTPIRIPGRDTAVILNRGWIYAPDGSTVNAAKWHERDTTFTGFVEEYPPVAGATFATRPNVVSRLGYDVVAKSIPYPVARVYVVMLGDSTMAEDRMARLTIPPLDQGPHFNYAVQWFAFAVVALAGAGFVIKQTRDEAAGRP